MHSLRLYCPAGIEPSNGRRLSKFKGNRDKVGPILIEFGWCRKNSFYIRAEFDRHWKDVGEVRALSAQNRPNLARIRPNWGRSGRHLASERDLLKNADRATYREVHSLCAGTHWSMIKSLTTAFAIPRLQQLHEFTSDNHTGAAVVQHRYYALTDAALHWFCNLNCLNMDGQGPIFAKSSLRP